MWGEQSFGWEDWQGRSNPWTNGGPLRRDRNGKACKSQGKEGRDLRLDYSGLIRFPKTRGSE